MRGRLRLGMDDVLILPPVLIAVVVKHLFKGTLSILIRILDYAFPILLQVVRFPLITVRIIGDGITAVLKGVAGYLPLSSAARAEWRDLVNRNWSWLRGKLSYRAFEEAIYDAFERGMGWVFRTCRALTPRAALLVLAGALLWLPVSFGIATAMHAVLIAKAASLAAWMQLLHLPATVIAKSKLLVLPVYPAAWPQAKKHSLVQATFRFARKLSNLRLVQKMGRRYRQIERRMEEAVDEMGRAGSLAGVRLFVNVFLVALDGLLARIGLSLRTAMMLMVEGFVRVPLIGSIVKSYIEQYAAAEHQPAGKFSEKAGAFFARWSIKFSAEYYEGRERDKPAAG